MIFPDLEEPGLELRSLLMNPTQTRYFVVGNQVDFGFFSHSAVISLNILHPSSVIVADAQIQKEQNLYFLNVNISKCF